MIQPLPRRSAPPMVRPPSANEMVLRAVVDGKGTTSPLRTLLIAARRLVAARQVVFVPTEGHPILADGPVDLGALQSHVPDGPAVGRLGATPVLAIPLAVAGRSLGVLWLIRGARDAAFVPDEIDAVSAVAATLALTLEHARLTEALSRVRICLGFAQGHTALMSEGPGLDPQVLDHLACVDTALDRSATLIDA